MNKAVKYLLFTFITSWTLQIIGSHDVKLDNAAGMMSFSHAVSLCMFMPALGVLFAGGKIRDMGWKPGFEKS